MSGVPLVHASALAPSVSFLTEIGTPMESLLARVGLPAGALTEPDALIPMHQVCLLVETAARAEGLEHLGFLIGQRTPFSAMGSYGRLVAQCFSLQEALHTAVRIVSAYTSDGRLRLTVDGERIWLKHALDRRLERGWREVEQFNVMIMIQLVRLTSHRAWRPREVRLRIPREVGLDRIEPLADARLSFGHAFTSIEIPRALLREPLVGIDPSVLTPKQLEQGLHRTAPAADFRGSVRQVVGTFLRDGYPSVQQVAGSIGTSVRTLQRRLTKSGVSYSRIVEEERLRLATELLTQSHLRFTDVALELGYADLAPFTHAFRRWTGLSPSEYRRNEIGTARRTS